jgi:hypothetical protein
LIGGINDILESHWNSVEDAPARPSVCPARSGDGCVVIQMSPGANLRVAGADAFEAAANQRLRR